MNDIIVFIILVIAWVFGYSIKEIILADELKQIKKRLKKLEKKSNKDYKKYFG